MRTKPLGGGRLAKIDLVTIFDCDYRWYCTIDYVIVIFSIIFNDFLAINHLLYIKDECKSSGEPGSVLELLLGMREAPGWQQNIFSVLICNNKKGKTT